MLSHLRSFSSLATGAVHQITDVGSPRICSSEIFIFVVESHLGQPKEGVAHTIIFQAK
jgi:hypothetical protein